MVEVVGEEDELEEDGKDAGVPGRCEVETSACDDTGRDTGVECFMRWNGGRVGIRRQYKSGSSTGRRERRGDSVCVCVCVGLGVQRETLSNVQGVSVALKLAASAE